MGITRTEAFTKQQNELASIAKALAHPARVAIIQYLVKEDRCICGDLVDVLPLAQATVSQHLGELKRAGLIEGTISGTSVRYCLHKVRWARCIAAIEALTNAVRTSTKCC